nr:alpha/beta hydrolase [Gordonia sp. SID5947]
MEELPITTVEVDGVSVGYTDTGSPTTGRGRPTVVLVHGTGGSARTHFPFLVPMLASRQRVVAIDLVDPNHNELSVEALERQLSAVLEHLMPAGVTLVGYSLGAVVAASLAGHRPDLVDNLVLIAGWMRTDAHQRIRNELWRQLRDSDPSAAQQLSILTAYSPGFLKLRRNTELQAMIDSVQFSAFKDAQMELNRQVDISDAVGAVTAETLIIGCRDDFMVPRHHSKQLFGAIERARYVEVLSGHAVVSERPAELVHWIDTFNADPARYPWGSIIDSPRP